MVALVCGIDQILFVWYWFKYNTYLSGVVALQFYSNFKEEYVSFLTINMFQ